MEQLQTRPTVPMTKELLLSILAGLYAIESNKKNRGRVYVCDVHREHGGPYTIKFDLAAEILADTATQVLDTYESLLSEKEAGTK